MATILEFRPASQPVTGPNATVPAGVSTAELIFFPGIRYERASQQEDLSQTTPKRARKRRVRPHDSIDLPD